jgi:CHRD domain-containing protein
MRKLLFAAALGALVVLVVLPAVGNAASTTLTAKLSGKEEVPKGDPNGSGTATVKIDPTKKTACFTIKLKNLEPTVAGHIHKGKKGKAGDIVVAFFGTKSSKTTRTGCARDQKASDLRDIIKHPGNYYVNVHTKTYPAGAARGQLEKATS